MGMNAQAPLSSYDQTKRFRRIKQGQTEIDTNHKFMQTIGEEMFSELERISNEKGIGVQTLLRAVIIPEWVKEHKLSESQRIPKGNSDRFERKKW